MNKTTETQEPSRFKLVEHFVGRERRYSKALELACSYLADEQAKEIADAMPPPEELAEPVKQEPVACQDSDDRRLLREIFMLCEATEEIEATNDFMRGRVFEAKGIRRGIGTWYQDTFCGRSYMGEPVIPAAPVDAKAIRAEALEDAVKFLEENGMIAPNGFTAAGIRGLK